MNLKDMITEINSALDYNPDLKQYDDNVARVINRHYLQVSSQYQWLFMQKRHLFTLRKDIAAGSNDRLTADGSRVVSLPTLIGVGTKNLPEDIVGQTLVIDNTEYMITHRRDARTFVVDSPIAAGAYATWTIKYTSYPMPRDSIEMLGIIDRGLKIKETVSYTTDSGTDTTSTTLTGPNRGRFIFLDARKEEYLQLDRQDTGDSFVSVEEMHTNLRPPDFAPLATITTSPSFDDKTIAIPGVTYDYCYTFTFAGKESSPSPVASIKVEQGKKSRITLIRIQDTSANYSDSSLDTGTGRYKKIYRRVSEKEDDFIGISPTLKKGAGPWRHIATIREDLTAYTDDFTELDESTVMEGTTFDKKISPSGDLFDSSYLNEIGPRQYLRFWYTPDSDYPVEARYHRRPTRLVNDSDSPDWPVQYHHYLVYAALRDICVQHGMNTNSQLYESRAKELLERMKSKYLSRTDRMHIRRGFDRAMADRERFGIPSKS